tara:strand:- start:105 stop:1232 length:1128 start_codon:yes stop_codon:yes gene_type:complete
VNVLVLLTYGMSFKSWDEASLLEREIKLYNEISKSTDINYTFLTYGDSQDLKYENLLHNSSIYPVYEHHKFYKNKFLRFLHSFLFVFLVRKKFQNIDLIKTNQLMGSWVGVLLKLLNRTPLIIRTGYDIFTFSLKNNKGVLKLSFYFLLTQFSLVFSDLYTVSSISDKSFLEKFFITKRKKIVVITNWVDYQQNTKPIPMRYKKKILSVGRLETQKNFEFLITEMGKTSIELDIYGKGSLDKKLKDLALSHNVKVNFLGNIPHSKLIKKMEDYKIFCLMSKFEGNPKVVLEAMSNGCVCILSNIPNNSEIIDDNKNGFLLKNTDNNVGIFVKNLLEQEDELNKISNEARNTIMEHYSLEKAIVFEKDNYYKVTAN